MSQSHKDVFELEATVQGWDNDYYHPTAVEYYDKAVPDMLKLLGAVPGSDVLDAGCGPGVHSIRAALAGCNVTAIDLSETMLAHARTRAEAAGVADKISYSQGDLTALTMDRQFPAVFNWGVIIHIPEFVQALDSLCSVVEPGGRLALHVLSNRAFDLSIERFVRNVLRKPFPEEVETELGTGFFYTYNDERLWVQHFDPDKLVADMARRGFRQVGHMGAEFSEFQLRTKGWLRNILLRVNAFVYKRQLFAMRSRTQIFVFEKGA